MNGPNGKNFPWGKIVKIHCVGDNNIEIVEYRPKIKAPHTGNPAGLYSDWSLFQPYVYVPDPTNIKWAHNERMQDSCQSYPSFDAALTGALAFKYEGENTHADIYICKMLGIERDARWP